MELMENPVIVENLNFSYGFRKVLDDVSFTISEGTLTSILGPNGSGKTTLLKLMLGFLRPQSGKITVSGRNLTELSLKERAKKLAYVPQKHNAVFGYSVIDVVALGRLPFTGIFCKLNDSDYHLAEESLNRLGISHLADRSYMEISGGEQQLTLVARALVQQADVLILDEPITGLDYGNQLLLLKQLRNLARSGITCIKTTHFPEHALWTSDNAIFLKNGKIIAAGKAEETINSEILKRLYDTDIKVIETNTGTQKLRTCVPEFEK